MPLGFCWFTNGVSWMLDIGGSSLVRGGSRRALPGRHGELRSEGVRVSEPRCGSEGGGCAHDGPMIPAAERGTTRSRPGCWSCTTPRPGPCARSSTRCSPAPRHEDIEGVEVVVRPALEATADDVLAADGYLLATPANFGYMSGALKHFFDSTFLAVGGALSADGSAGDSAGAYGGAALRAARARSLRHRPVRSGRCSRSSARSVAAVGRGAGGPGRRHRQPHTSSRRARRDGRGPAVAG